MKLSTLLSHREALLQQARLANLAFAYAKLADFAARAARAHLRGAITLRPAAPDLERYCAAFTALEANQSVIEEHFTEEDAMDLADVIAFLSGKRDTELTFRIEEMAEKFLVPLRLELERHGVRFTAQRPRCASSDGDGFRGCPQIDEKD